MTKYKRPRMLHRAAPVSCRTDNHQRAPVGLVVFGVLTACSYQNLDYLSSELGTPEAVAANCNVDESETAGAQAPVGVKSVNAANQLASGGPATVAGPFDFDSANDLQGWSISDGSGTGLTATWIAAGRSAPLGAVQLTTVEVAQLSHSVSHSDLSQFVLKAVLRSDDSAAMANPYVISNGRVLADGGGQAVGADWAIVSLDVGNAFYASTDFEPKQIITLGLELSARATFVIDAIWLE